MPCAQAGRQVTYAAMATEYTAMVRRIAAKKGDTEAHFDDIKDCVMKYERQNNIRSRSCGCDMAKPKKKQDPKVDALRTSGTLNPHPEKVRDQLFSSNEFFDSRDLMQVKYEMLRRVKEEGWSITEAAVAFGFSRTALYDVQSDFDEAGMSGFIPERRGPREAHKLSGPVLNFVEETKQQDQSVRTPQLVALIKQKFGIDVHRRSIERALNRKKKRER